MRSTTKTVNYRKEETTKTEN